MSESTSSSSRGPVPDRRRRLLILLICSMSLLIVGLDNTIVNVALPAIHRSLHASFGGSAVDDRRLHPRAGQPADAVGLDRRPNRAQAGCSSSGSLLFSLGSLLLRARALEPGRAHRVRAALQAIGGSMLNPVAMSIIRNVFDDPRERARAIGVWGGVDRHQPWRSGRWSAVRPRRLGRLALPCSWSTCRSAPWRRSFSARCIVPESRAERPRRLDPVGQLLVIVTLGLTHLRDHRGTHTAGGCSSEILDPVRPRDWSRWRRSCRLRAPSRGPPAGDPLLRQRPVLGQRARLPCLRVRRASAASCS